MHPRGFEEVRVFTDTAYKGSLGVIGIVCEFVKTASQLERGNESRLKRARIPVAGEFELNIVAVSKENLHVDRHGGFVTPLTTRLRWSRERTVAQKGCACEFTESEFLIRARNSNVSPIHRRCERTGYR